MKQCPVHSVVLTSSVIPQPFTEMVVRIGRQSMLQPFPGQTIASTAAMTTSCTLCWMQCKRKPPGENQNGPFKFIKCGLRMSPF